MMAGGPHHALADPNLEPLAPIPTALARVLGDNERLMDGLSLRGTPGIVFRTPNGQVATRAGLAPTDLPLILGPL
jgi:hypothetical protein